MLRRWLGKAKITVNRKNMSVIRAIESQSGDHWRWVCFFMKKKRLAIPVSLRAYCGVNNPGKRMGIALAEELHLYTHQDDIGAFFLKLAFTHTKKFVKAIYTSQLRVRTQPLAFDFKKLFQAASNFIRDTVRDHTIIFGRRSTMTYMAKRYSSGVVYTCNSAFTAYLEWMTDKPEYCEFADVFYNKKSTTSIKSVYCTLRHFIWNKFYSYSITNDVPDIYATMRMLKIPTHTLE